MLNPILSFSATRRMRSFRTMLIVIGYVAALLLIALAFLTPFLKDTVGMGTLSNGPTCFLALLGAQFILLILIAPAMTSGSIAGERERQTLELLLVTNTRSFRIATGKMMESFALLALMIVGGLPAMCMTVAAGGVTFGQILVSMLFLLAVAFGTVCVGVFASACCRTSVRSGVMSYRIIAVIAVVTALPVIFGYPQKITDVVYDRQAYAALTSGEALHMIHPLLFFNPGYGLAALLQAQTSILSSGSLENIPGFGTAMAQRQEYGEWGRLLCTYLVMEKAGGQTIALNSSCALIAAGSGLMGIATLLIRPRRRKGLKE